MSQEEYKIGSRVFEDWEIVRVIGHGAFGYVYELQKNEYGVTARSALKVIRIPASQSELEEVLFEATEDDRTAMEETSSYFKQYVDEMVKEIAIMTSLKGHPHIVACEDYKVIRYPEEIRWDILIRMELLTPLDQYIKQQGGRLEEKTAVRLGQELLSALSACEAKKIIHRDIKPANIFVTEDGTFKLGDFGVARTLEKASAELSRKGTESYMAPEVYLGREYDRRADLYSLGLVLYRLVNRNRLPFQPLTAGPVRPQDKEEALGRRLRGEVFPLPAEGSPALASVIDKACALSPSDRYENAASMQADLAGLPENAQEQSAFDEEDDRTYADRSFIRDKKKTDKPLTEKAEEPEADDVTYKEKKIPVKKEPEPVSEKKPADQSGDKQPEKKTTEKKPGEKQPEEPDFSVDLSKTKIGKGSIAAIVIAVLILAGGVLYAVIPKTKTVTVNGGQGSGKFKAGETVAIQADQPEEGKLFEKWSVTEGKISLADETAPATTFSMPSESVALTAVYADRQYEIVVQNGSGSGKYANGEKISVQAEPAPAGQTFDRWEVVSGTAVPEDERAEKTTFTVSDDSATIEAVYVTAEYTAAVEGGTGSGSYKENEVVTIAAEDKKNFIFDGWKVLSGNVELMDPSAESTTFTMGTEDIQLQAVYQDLTVTDIQIVEDPAKEDIELEIQTKSTDDNSYRYLADIDSYPFRCTQDSIWINAANGKGSGSFRNFLSNFGYPSPAMYVPSFTGEIYAVIKRDDKPSESHFDPEITFTEDSFTVYDYNGMDSLHWEDPAHISVLQLKASKKVDGELCIRYPFFPTDTELSETTINVRNGIAKVIRREDAASSSLPYRYEIVGFYPADALLDPVTFTYEKKTEDIISSDGGCWTIVNAGVICHDQESNSGHSIYDENVIQYGLSNVLHLSDDWNLKSFTFDKDGTITADEGFMFSSGVISFEDEKFRIRMENEADQELTGIYQIDNANYEVNDASVKKPEHADTDYFDQLNFYVPFSYPGDDKEYAACLYAVKTVP